MTIIAMMMMTMMKMVMDNGVGDGNDDAYVDDYETLTTLTLLMVIMMMMMIFSKQLKALTLLCFMLWRCILSLYKQQTTNNKQQNTF